MIFDTRFADYISVRKVTPQEIEENSAYPNATVTTVVTGIKGLKEVLETQFPGESFVEHSCNGIIDSEYERLLHGYVSYSIEISYVERANDDGQTIAESECWGGMHKYV